MTSMFQNDVITVSRYQSYIEKTDSCHPWGGYINPRSGYGYFSINGKVMLAHRYAFFLANGDFDPKKFVCHSCDVRWCVNPDHLFLGDALNNNRDTVSKNRGRWGDNRPSANPVNIPNHSAEKGKRNRPPIPIMAKVLGNTEKTESCWLYRGTISPSGYGTVSHLGKLLPAHRVMYEHFVGPIPKGMDLRHTCDVRICVNPSHLIPGTRKENMQDAVLRGRIATGDRHRSKLYPDKILRGEQVNSSVVTEQQVIEIKKLLQSGAGRGKISRIIGCSYHIVWYIDIGRTWIHVKIPEDDVECG